MAAPASVCRPPLASPRRHSRNPRLLEQIVSGLGVSPSPEAEELLLKLAEDDARFYTNHTWRDAKNPDVDSLLLLIAFESEQKRALVDWRALEHVVTTHVPSEHWVGAYDVVPVSAVELRKRLLELLPGNDSNHPAARCLNNIDKIRDHYGAPESEPRHPNLASGRAWPIITPDPDAEGE